MKKTNPEFLNGVPELLVLQLLARREMYGYEIVNEVLARSGEEFRYGEGCIYDCLHAWENGRLVTSRRMAGGGRSRMYYRLTEKGRKRLEMMTTEWKRVASGVALVLGGEHA